MLVLLGPLQRPTVGTGAGRRTSATVPTDGAVFMTLSSPRFSHEPVMLSEVLDVFASVDHGVLVDATVGGGGHAKALLEAHHGIRLIGLDRDPAAIAAAASNLEAHQDRVELRHARFDSLGVELDTAGVTTIAGVLFDLGVSSHQLDVPERGFSFRAEGPLDMRMDPTSGQSAADYINTVSERDLATVLADYGDERHSRRIAAAIVKVRPIASTAQLAETIVEAMPAASRRAPGHPARRSFQAIRIAVNEELAVLEPSLGEAITRLAPGGRGAVLSYHSGEDRIVKKALRVAAGLGKTYRRGLPAIPGEEPQIELLHRGGYTPSAAELDRNPRSSAARLRSFERIGAAA